MAELSTTDLTISAIKTALGSSGNSLSVLNKDSGINKWSFYRPGSISANATTKLVELTADTTPYKMGDFRRYNHTALTPHAAADYTQNWGPGGSTMSVTLATYIERLNVKELVPSTTMYFTVDYYLSSANRAAKTSRQRRQTFLLNLSTETPPAGHTNNQTQAPSSSFQLLTDTGVPTSILTKPNDVLYCDTYISDLSSTELIRFDDSYTDISTHEVANPITSKAWGNWTPVPAGYTFIATAVTNSSSNGTGVDFTETIDTTYGLFYWFVYGLKGTHYYRIGDAVVTTVLRIAGKTDTPILTAGALKTAASNSNESASGTLAGGASWAYDDEGDIVITAADWTGMSEYDLGTTAP